MTEYIPNTIFLASDHAGFELKNQLVKWLEKNGHKVVDLGTNGPSSVDYPDYGHLLAEQVEESPYNYGIAICGSGIGISIAANRHENIRAALCQNIELAELARKHNNANILALGARFITFDRAKKVVDAFFTTKFEGGRHETRVNKL